MADSCQILESHWRFGTTRSLLLPLAVALASTVGMAASTIYVPSIPDIAAGFHTSAAAVQLSFAVYLAAMAGGMLVLGPLSDMVGRRRILRAGLGLCLVGTLICVFSPSIQIFIAARVLQGVGASAGSVVGRAAIRDAYGRDQAARVIARIAFFVTVLQSGAPLLGGQINAFAGWRWAFVLIALLTVLNLWVAKGAVPACRSAGLNARNAAQSLNGYADILANRRFLAYALAATGAHAGFHIFSAGAPVVFLRGFGVTATAYGLYAFLPPLGFLVGSTVSGLWRLGVDRMVSVGMALILQGGILLVVSAAAGVATPWLVVAFVALICCGSGIATPSAIAGALSAEPAKAGTASGFITFCQLAGAAGATVTLTFLPSTSLFALSIVILCAGAAGLLGYTALIVDRRTRHPIPLSQL